MRRLAVLLSCFALLSAGAQARPQRYAGISPPQPQHAATHTNGPGWTAVILGGIAVMLVGVAAGRASVRPQVRVARQA
jgi:hypothetical protein